jgi:choline monooxygenase
MLTTNEFQAITQPINTATGLPNRAYRGEDWAESERENLLAKTWTCVGFIDDLEPGWARPIDLLGVPLLQVRGTDGTTRIFHNVCRHRGIRLFTEKAKLPRGGVVCPYHNWGYGFDGCLKVTPHIGGPGKHEVAGFNKSDHGLAPVRHAMWMGMVFVNLDGQAQDFASHIAPLETRWSKFIGPNGIDELRTSQDGCALELPMKANWKLAVDNYLESYHLPMVHPGLNSYSRLEDHYNITEGDIGAGQGSLAFNYSDREGINLPGFSAWPEELKSTAEYIALYPNVLLGLQFDHAYALMLQPITCDTTQERLRIFYVGDESLSEPHSAERHSVLEGWRDVFLEDVGVVQGMHLGRASPSYTGGVFSPVMETPTHHFHNWVAARMHQPQVV